MKAIYNFEKIGFKLKALFFTIILLASFYQAGSQTLTVTSTVDPGVICAGSSTTVVGNIATSPIPNGSTILWSWVGAGGTFSKTSTAINSGNTESTSLVINPTATGSFVLTVSEGTYSGTATTAVVTVTPIPSATISYAGSPYCTSLGTPQLVTQTGTTGGTYTSTTGLTLNTSTGAVTPSSSTPGTYLVSYIVTSACPTATFTTSVTITQAPVTPTIAYTTPVCSSALSASVTQTGASGGTYSISKISGSGPDATINASSGLVSFPVTTGGTYSITYALAASGGCATETAYAPLVITTLPTATISYTDTPYCQSSSDPTPTNTGSGGTFTSTTGLVFVSTSTGQVDLSASTAGSYTVSYIIPASGGCTTVTATTPVTITAAPIAPTISYITPVCASAGTATVTQTGASGGTYSITRLSGTGTLATVDASSGTVSFLTTSAGTYSITYTVSAAGGCATVTTSASLDISTVPSATAGGSQSICSNGTATVSGASATNYSTIAWTENGAGSITAGADTFTPTYTAASGDAGNTVTLLMTVTGSSSGCGTVTATATYSVLVVGSTVITANPVDQTICEGSTASFTVATAPTLPAPSYQWYVNSFFNCF